MESEQIAVLVGCGDKKSTEREVSWKLYESSYYELKMSAAMCIGIPYTLSAKHKLVSAHTRLDPYDYSEITDEWAKDVADSIPDGYSVCFLASRRYVEPILKYLSDEREVYDPLKQCSGIGEQMGWCKEASKQISNGVDVRGVISDGK